MLLSAAQTRAKMFKMTRPTFAWPCVLQWFTGIRETLYSIKWFFKHGGLLNNWVCTMHLKTVLQVWFLEHIYVVRAKKRIKCAARRKGETEGRAVGDTRYCVLCVRVLVGVCVRAFMRACVCVCPVLLFCCPYFTQQINYWLTVCVPFLFQTWWHLPMKMLRNSE